MKERARLVGAVAVGALGVALLAGRFWIGGVPWPTPISNVAPVGAALCLFGAAAWIARSDVEGRRAFYPLAGAIGGMVAFAAFAGVVTGELLTTAVGLPSRLLTFNFLAFGSVFGVAIGTLAATNDALVGDVGDGYRFEDVGDAALVHDARGVVRAANEAAMDRLGYDAESLGDRRVTDVEGEVRGARVRRDGSFGYETTHATADGEEIPVAVTASPVRYRGDRAVLTVARDVSHRRERERELAETRERLEAVNRVLRHDVRNDMQIVLGMARLLQDRLDADPDTADRLRSIIDAGEHAVELTRSSRELSRTLAGEADPSLHPVSLAETLTTELERRRSAYGNATFAVEGSIPDVTVRANELLPSVFRNLLNNAVQHSDRAEPIVTVSADRDAGGDRVTVRVADDGPGISADRRSAVFEEAEAGVDSEGTGLGLFLVRSLVEQYGGSVWIEENEPRGTVVAVQLLVEAARARADEAAPGPDEAPSDPDESSADPDRT